MSLIATGGGQLSIVKTSADRVSRIETHLWPGASRHNVWMIVDAARDRRIYDMLFDCFYSRHTCLFSGPSAPVLQVVAPYLIQLEHDNRKTRQFLSQAWSQSWGIFLQSDAPFESLRRHVRELVLARDESGKKLIFRYYDPRILKVYLPTCTTGELHAFFGSIESFIVEDTSDALLRFGLNKGQLITTRSSLSEVSAPSVGLL